MRSGAVGATGAGPIPIELRVRAPGVACVRLGKPHEASPASYLPPGDWRSVSAAVDGALLDIGDVVIRRTGNPETLTFYSRDGRELLRLAISESEFGARLRLRLGLVGEQHFYGLGEGGQQFDRLGTTRRLWNYQASRAQGADMAIPLLVSQAGYAVFFDSSAAATIEAGDAGDGTWIEYRNEHGDGLDVYFIGGADLRAVMRGVADLLGHATMPPRWALGYLQSSRHFADTQEVRHLAEQFREKQLPCDGLIFLSTYGLSKGWNRGVGHLEFEPGLFDDPAAILGEFRRRNFHIVLHEYPVLHGDSPLAAEANRDNHLLEHAYPSHPPGRPRETNYKEGQRLIDFSRPETRSWWWRSHRPLAQLGVEGWWLDGGEGPPAETMLSDGPATLLHNRYDLMRQQGFAEDEARDRPDKRPYLLCRSGGPGMQRYGAMPWSGDVNTTFETMAGQIRVGLNVGMSGVPHWGTDIGGFFRVAPDQGELFARWFQFAAFCSVFRGHGHVWRHHLPWSYGDEIEAICRRYLELRYRLMPYTYTLAWQAHRDGLPLMRPLVLNYPDDPRVWDLGEQYLWGDDLLVAPVTRPGATHWPVYLPEGVWHDFWTGDAYRGPRGITVDAPLDRLPLFVRAGAILPLGPVMQHDGERPLDEVTLLAYPDGSSSFTLYEDDGVSNAYLQGRSLRTTFTCSSDSAGVVCAVGASEGDRTLIPSGRSYVFQIHAPQRPRAVAIDGQGALPEGAAAGPSWRHDGERFLFLRMPESPAAARIVW